MSISKDVEIYNQIMSYTESRLGQTLPRFQRSFVSVFAKPVAGVIGLAYRFVDWCLKQTQPATCNEFWLGIWATRYEVPRGSAVAAKLTVSLSGTDGTVIPAGSTWSASNGLVYQTDADATVSGGSASVAVTCLTAGASGNLSNGAALSLVTPISGAETEGTVSATATEGVDRESVASWRAQVMLRIAYKPQGGAVPDYVTWALEVPGIVKALVKRPAAGDVNVYGLVDTTGVSRVPGSAKLAELLAHLNDPIRKPMCANVYAPATVERTCAVTITTATINGSVLTSGQRATVESAITAMIYAAYPRQYADEANPTDTVDVGMVWDALRAIGATAASVAITISGIGGGPYVLPIGEIVAPGAYTWA